MDSEPPMTQNFNDSESEEDEIIVNKTQIGSKDEVDKVDEVDEVLRDLEDENEGSDLTEQQKKKRLQTQRLWLLEWASNDNTSRRFLEYLLSEMPFDETFPFEEASSISNLVWHFCRFAVSEESAKQENPLALLHAAKLLSYRPADEVPPGSPKTVQALACDLKGAYAMCRLQKSTKEFLNYCNSLKLGSSVAEVQLKKALDEAKNRLNQTQKRSEAEMPLKRHYDLIRIGDVISRIRANSPFSPILVETFNDVVRAKYLRKAALEAKFEYAVVCTKGKYVKESAAVRRFLNLAPEKPKEKENPKPKQAAPQAKPTKEKTKEKPRLEIEKPKKAQATNDAVPTGEVQEIEVDLRNGVPKPDEPSYTMVDLVEDSDQEQSFSDIIERRETNPTIPQKRKMPTAKDITLKSYKETNASGIPHRRSTVKVMRKRWSKEEEENLIKGVARFSTSWTLIYRYFRENFQDRTTVDLKDKWRNLMKHQPQQTQERVQKQKDVLKRNYIDLSNKNKKQKEREEDEEEVLELEPGDDIEDADEEHEKNKKQDKGEKSRKEESSDDDLLQSGPFAKKMRT
eukprot:TRINITY_DN8264_c0_g1_i1.p1 TRINITY_DN8264_c0_g1~~TRINITY_DN8264_c0_g1_i1.p1  ORF type:complete len:589 (-),score=140.44 TRINITY_DN8264_c0_g1_i1:63-1772(-)